ncbi:MAG: sulfur carrier protein ThiS [Bacteroidales bacterium]|nr:sulfur carrier protein ThiS [Bacteroidales bacterium]
MKITFNGNTEDFSSTTLAELLESKGLADKTGIAVALNNTVVPRTEWGKTRLGEGDRILLIGASYGG